MGEKSNVYLVLAIIGALVPLTLSGVFIANEGLDFGALVDQLEKPAALAVLADVTISSAVFWVWMWPQARTAGKSPWLFVVANLFVGLSFALPLFLHFRERAAVRA